MHSFSTFARGLALASLALLIACGSDPVVPAGDVGGGDAESDLGIQVDAIPQPDAGGGSSDAPDVAADLGDDAGQDVVSDPRQDAPGDAAGCTTLGCPCVDDGECASGYCIEGVDRGEFICSQFCDGACSDPAYECVLLENSGGDAVRLCVPAADRQCQPCRIGRDCGGLDTVCAEMIDGTFCAAPCGDGVRCPSGHSCQSYDEAGELVDVCLPDFGVCSACYDPDGDRFGRGVACLGVDCDEEDRDVNPGEPEICDGLDQNCNGDVDEGFDLLGDPTNCGGCGIVCDATNGTPVCVGGECGIEGCEDGWADCNGRSSDGCETDLSAPETCGTCAILEGTPGEACGDCGDGVWTCDDAGGVECVGASDGGTRNACGGCRPLLIEPGVACGACGTGAFECLGPEATICIDGTNCPPTAPVVTIVPATPTALDDLTCTIVEESVDLDGDDVTYRFEWERFGVFERAGATLSASSLDIDDQWNCVAIPSDGEMEGEAGRSPGVLVRDPCADGELNGNESAVDCGGDPLLIGGEAHSCPRCPSGEECVVDDDCIIGYFCDGTCRRQVCPVGELFCVGDQRWLCDARGASSTFISDCILGCDGGSCEVGCGDGIVGAGEFCDDGAENSDVEADACRTDCTIARCGDGVVDTGEECDGGEACSDECELTVGLSCLQLHEAGATDDGLYMIDPDGAGGFEPTERYCDMNTDGGGWTLVYIVRNDVPQSGNYWPQVVPGSGSVFPTTLDRPGAFFSGPDLATRSAYFDASGATEWRGTLMASDGTVRFDVRSDWTGGTGIAFRCFATGQGSCGAVTQTCSDNSDDATVIENNIGGPIAAGGTGHVCDVGWTSCSGCVDWSSVRTDNCAGCDASRRIRYVGDTSIDHSADHTAYWIR